MTLLGDIDYALGFSVRLFVGFSLGMILMNIIKHDEKIRGLDLRLEYYREKIDEMENHELKKMISKIYQHV